MSKDFHQSVRRLCKLLTLTRSDLNYKSKGASVENLRFLEIIVGSKGAWRDDRMIERLWRSLEDKCVYLTEVP